MKHNACKLRIEYVARTRINYIDIHLWWKPQMCVVGLSGLRNDGGCLALTYSQTISGDIPPPKLLEEILLRTASSLTRLSFVISIIFYKVSSLV
jgi:hypothetical protein